MTNLSRLEQDLLAEIREVLVSTRRDLVYSVNHTMVYAYWNIGRLIVQHEQKGEKHALYGKNQLKQLATRLTTEFGKGFYERNLRRMRAFYQIFPIWTAVRSELSWTHYRALIQVDNETARNWYIQECIEQSWSARALERQINKLYYERLLASKNKEPVVREALKHNKNQKIDVKQYLRDPYILDFLNLPYDSLLESDIEQGLMNNLQKFLLELGKGFAFVSRQQRISTEDQDFYIDLVFYNYKLKCFLLIDIKLDKLAHQDVGQMDSYIRIYDQHKKGSDDNPTIGLILCSQKSEAIAKYSILTESKQLFASKYLPYLPSEEELREELERERALLSNSSQPKE